MPERILCAVLLNPALRDQPSTTTYRNVSAATSVVGCDQLVVANLVNTPTKDASELNRKTPPSAELESSRVELLLALAQAHEVLLAWGMGGMTGATRLVMRSQVRWLSEALAAHGVDRVWTILGRPRHPSRWRQYVGPEKQRVAGATYEERLGKILVPIQLSTEAGQELFTQAF